MKKNPPNNKDVPPCLERTASGESLAMGLDSTSCYKCGYMKYTICLSIES